MLRSVIVVEKIKRGDFLRSLSGIFFFARGIFFTFFVSSRGHHQSRYIVKGQRGSASSLSIGEAVNMGKPNSSSAKGTKSGKKAGKGGARSSSTTRPQSGKSDRRKANPGSSSSKGNSSSSSRSSSSSKHGGPKKDTYDYEHTKIRNERNRAGDVSDDSDGELKGEDESIDDEGSEVGWDSDDELAYGHIFNKGKAAQIHQDEEEKESDQEEAFEGEMLLSDMLEGNMKKKDDTVSKVVGRKRSAENDVEEEDEEEEGSYEEEYMEDDGEEDDDDELDDEEGDDDEEDDDEDEDDDDEDDDDEGDDNEGEEDDDEEAHDRLMNAINKFAQAGNDTTGSKKRAAAKASQRGQESMFSSAADDGAVSMDALLNALGDAKGLNVVKKQLSELAKATAVPTFVEKTIADRASRTLAYEESATDMAKWQETVSTNRHARTLDLAQDKRQLPNYRDLVKNFKPTTDMEREVS